MPNVRNLLQSLADALSPNTGTSDGFVDNVETSLARISQALPEILGGKIEVESLADEYDDQATYDIGDYCTHDGVLYICATAVATDESWDSAKWVAVPLIEILQEKLDAPATGAVAGRYLMVGQNGEPVWDQLDESDIRQSVYDWLSAHPEAIVVNDGTITRAKLDSSVGQAVDEVSELKADLSQLGTEIRVIAARDDSWSAIRENVKMGFGELLYPVGTEFEVTCPSGAPYNSIIFVVVDHRVENSEHIMTMLMKHVIYSTEFDAIQAIICPEETMAAGTYHFALLSGHDTTYDGGKNVQFTLANDLEAGGQIVMNWPYNQTWIGKNLTVYHAFGTSAVETCIMSEGTGGTDLGAADGTVSILNHTQRARYGSNNYEESAIREWLDSDDAANAWQTQQTRFQRPCSYRTRAGFVTYLDPEFVAVIREGSHPNRTNEIFDLNGKKQAYSTTDKFYLASQEEIGFSSESGIVCGTVFDYYNGASQADKIKYDIAAQTTARYWWLRTPNPSYASLERHVTSSGALVYITASSGIGAVAACEI